MYPYIKINKYIYLNGRHFNCLTKGKESTLLGYFITHCMRYSCLNTVNLTFSK